MRVFRIMLALLVLFCFASSALAETATTQQQTTTQPQNQGQTQGQSTQQGTVQQNPTSQGNTSQTQIQTQTQTQSPQPQPNPPTDHRKSLNIRNIPPEEVEKKMQAVGGALWGIGVEFMMVGFLLVIVFSFFVFLFKGPGAGFGTLVAGIFFLLVFIYWPEIAGAIRGAAESG